MSKAISVTVSLPRDLVDRLDAEAAGQSRSRSSMARYVLERAFDDAAPYRTASRRIAPPRNATPSPKE